MLQGEHAKKAEDSDSDMDEDDSESEDEAEKAHLHTVKVKSQEWSNLTGGLHCPAASDC